MCNNKQIIVRQHVGRLFVYARISYVVAHKGDESYPQIVNDTSVNNKTPSHKNHINNVFEIIYCNHMFTIKIISKSFYYRTLF